MRCSLFSVLCSRNGYQDGHTFARVRFSQAAGRASAAVLLVLAVLLVAGLLFNLENLGSDLDTDPAPPAGSEYERDLVAILGIVPLLPVGLGIAAFLVLISEPTPRRPARRHTMRPRPRVLRPFAKTLLFLTAFLAPLVALQIGAFSFGDSPWALPMPWDRYPSGGPSDTSPPSAYDLVPLLAVRIASLAQPFRAFVSFVGILSLVVPVPVVPLLLTILGEGTVAAYIVVRRLMRRAPIALEREAPEEPSVGADGLPGEVAPRLEIASDPRSSVLRCFLDFCAAVRQSGVVFGESSSAREVEELAVAELGVSADAAEGLISLFEEARYSQHSLTEQAAIRARDSLDRIVEGLRGVRPGARPRSSRSVHVAGPVPPAGRLAPGLSHG